MARTPKHVKQAKAHQIMRKAHDNGTITIVTDFAHLNRGGSPVYSPWDNVAPLLLMILVSLGLMLLINLIIGTGMLLLSTIVYAFGVRSWVAYRIHQRTVAAMLENPHNWTVLWETGGVAVGRTDRPGMGVRAPQGDWVRFATKNLPEAEEIDIPREPGEPEEEPDRPPPPTGSLG